MIISTNLDAYYQEMLKMRMVHAMPFPLISVLTKSVRQECLAILTLLPTLTWALCVLGDDGR